MNKNKFILYFVLLFFLSFIPINSYCYEPTKTVIITKEDIKNSNPISPYPVEFSQKEIKSVKMIEKRVFEKTYEDLDDNTRLMQLEYELFGKVWKYTPKKDRIKKLEIASMNYMLSGTSLPAIMSSRENAKKMSSDIVKKKNDVGLIDGFLRLINPEKYELYRKYSDNMYNSYEF